MPVTYYTVTGNCYYDWALWVFLAFYLILNIVGTIYYTLLKRKGVSEGARAVGLTTVLLGWTGLPILNLTSVALYGSDFGK